jgi:hypothetical protein
VAAAICDGLGSCCRSAGFPFDDAACRNQWVTGMSSEAPTSTAVSYDANVAGECVASLRPYVAACGTAPTPTTDACARIYVGTKPEGAACQSDEECARPAQGFAYCNDGAITSADAGTSSTPVCVVEGPEVHGTVGQGCSMTCTTDGSGESCGASGSFGSADGGSPTPTPGVACFTNDGVYCSPSYTCQRMAEVGGACDLGGCVRGAYCDSTSRVCVALGQPGAACSGQTCVDTAFCGTAGVCEAKKANGEPCSVDTMYSECLGYCSAGGVCATDTGTGYSVNADTCSNYDVD